MRIGLRLLPYWLLILVIAGCTQQETPVARPATVRPAPPPLEARRSAPAPWHAPTPHGDCYAGCPVSLDPQHPVAVLAKQFFTIGYCEQRKDPAWVCYRIGPATDLTPYKRPSKFRTDTETSARVTHADYTNTPYSRGHMAPKFAIGSRHGKAGSDSTFIMSNICPQYQSFNDGQWGDLEEDVAGHNAGGTFAPGWADLYQEVWVVVGPIFDEPRQSLPSGVEVPSAFYCIVVDEEADRPRMIAFIMPHVNQRVSGLRQFLTSVDAIEHRTHLDFFRDLPDDLENQIEAQTQPDLWARN